MAASKSNVFNLRPPAGQSHSYDIKAEELKAELAKHQGYVTALTCVLEMHYAAQAEQAKKVSA